MDEAAPLASEEDDDDWLAAEIATGLTFASSDAVMLTEAKGLHPMARSIAVLVIVVSLLGFANGLDFASPEQGVVRPDEFVYAMSRAAPEDTAIFRGSVVDEAGEGLENVVQPLDFFPIGKSITIAIRILVRHIITNFRLLFFIIFFWSLDMYFLWK